MKPKLMGIKQGMMQVFDEKGGVVVCTVIFVETHLVSQIKTVERDGYNAIQLACGKLNAAKARKVSHPRQGLFKKAGIEPRRFLHEVRSKNGSSLSLGHEIGVESFCGISYVDVIGVSKGKGYQGVMKRHHFAGGPAAHGSGFHRHGGSCGMRSTPGRCLPGQKKAGRMGGARVTVENLRVVKVSAKDQYILVEGAVPGAVGRPVFVLPAKKKQVVRGAH